MAPIFGEIDAVLSPYRGVPGALPAGIPVGGKFGINPEKVVFSREGAQYPPAKLGDNIYRSPVLRKKFYVFKLLFSKPAKKSLSGGHENSLRYMDKV
jgi:hypothetical protein